MKRTVGGLWLTIFCAYWAWHFAGAVGLLVLVAAFVGLVVWVKR